MHQKRKKLAELTLYDVYDVARKSSVSAKKQASKSYGFLLKRAKEDKRKGYNLYGFKHKSINI